jgi:hypothetical protein
MRIETTVRVEDGELAVTVNPGSGKPFATIDFDTYSYVRLKTMDDCDRLVRAAVAVRRRFEAAVKGDAHPFAEGFPRGHCDTCGMLKDEKLHAGPLSPEAAALDASIAAGTPVIVTDEPPNPPHHMTGDTPGASCLAEDGGYICNAQDGHDGPDHVAYGNVDQECYRWPLQGWCPAYTVLDDDETVSCDRQAGHIGSHHAHVPGDTAEVAWSDEPEDHPDTAGPA